jgi:glycosyltransferase involved in cell wall biosynthesis
MKPLDIVIDWQPMMLNRSGVGYYIYNIIEDLAKVDTKNKYTLVAFSIYAKKYVFNIGKNFKTKIIRFPSSKYLLFMEKKINVPIELFVGFHNIYFFGNFLRYPLIKGKSITVIHDLTFIKHPEAVEQKNLEHLSKLVPYSIEHSDRLVTVSEAMRDEISEYYHRDKDTIHVIYPVVRFAKPTTQEENNVATRIKKKFLFFISSIEPRKNVLRLVQAYKMLPDEIKKEYSLVLAGGSGWNSEDVLTEIQKKEKIGEVIYVGYVNETEREWLFSHASMYTFPAIYEGFGMTILEAMDHDLPVLTSDIPALKEIAQDAALYVDPTDLNDISMKMKQLLEDSNLRDTLVTKSKPRLEYFKSQHQAQDLYDLFMQLA